MPTNCAVCSQPIYGTAAISALGLTCFACFIAVLIRAHEQTPQGRAEVKASECERVN